MRIMASGGLIKTDLEDLLLYKVLMSTFDSSSVNLASDGFCQRLRRLVQPRATSVFCLSFKKRKRKGEKRKGKKSSARSLCLNPTHPSHSTLSSINLVSIFRGSSPPHNPVYTSRVDPSVLTTSLSSHRRSHTSFLFNSQLID
jgi:hypothetical protein